MIDVNVGVEELIYIFNMNCDKRKLFGNQSGNFLIKKREMVMLLFVRDFLLGNFLSIVNYLKLI